MDRRLDFIIINETAYLLVLQLYMQRFSFYQFQIYKIQIGYICNELELNNPSLNHKNHFAKTNAFFKYRNDIADPKISAAI